MGQKEDESLIRLLDTIARRPYQLRIDALLQLQDLAMESDNIEQLKSLRSNIINSMTDFKDTIPEAARVRQIADKVENFISERLYAAIDKKKEGPKLKGLKTIHSPEQVKAYFLAMIGKFIHPSTTESQFLAIFQDNILPLKWSQVKWIGSRKDCFSFMMDMCGDEVKPKTINMYFQQYAIDLKTKKINTKKLTSNQRTNCNRGFLKGL